MVSSSQRRSASRLVVEVGATFDGGRPSGLWVEGDAIYVADGADGLVIPRFRAEGGT